MKATICPLLFTFLLFATAPLQATTSSPPSKPLRFFAELIPDESVTGFAAASQRGFDVHGDLAVVGSGVFNVGASQGSAIVFDISNPRNPREIARLRPSDNQAGNEFGNSVAVWGNRVYVGAHGANVDTGAVYMYDLSDLSNITERKLTAFDASTRSYFGFDIAVSGDRLIAGSPFFSVLSPPASAYVLDLSDPNNIQQTKLLPTAGSSGGNFAEQVDISGDLAVVGHISERTVTPFAGAAHVYDLSNFDNPRQQLVRSTLPRRGEAFGKTVAVDGETVLVSVASDPGDENLSGASDGAVWAFDFSDWNNPTQHEFGRMPGGSFPAPFGRGLALAGDTALTGAFNENGSRGAAYIYDVSNTNSPSELDRIASPINSATRFGRGLAFDGTSAIIASGNRVFLYSTVPEPSTALLATIAMTMLVATRRTLSFFDDQ